MTVTPVSDPCVGNLATPVNSGYFIKGLISNLPFYRSGISPNFRGLETGAAFGYLLYGPFTILGPLRNTEYQQTAGLLATIGAVHILTLLFLLYNQPGKQPNIPPADSGGNATGPLFQQENSMFRQLTACRSQKSCSHHWKGAN